jgi:hypothetical protein
MTRIDRRNSGGAQILVLLLIVGGLVAGGVWNYQRNLAAERAAEAARPLSGYSTADLEALAAAYRQEISAFEARYAKSRGNRAEARDRAYFDDQVREFEKVQQATTRTRAAGGDVAEREAALRDVEGERASRGPASSEWQIHLRRLTSY